MLDSFNSHGTLRVGDDEYGIHRLDALAGVGNIDKLPFSLRVLLENLLRREDGEAVSEDDIRALAGWQPGKSSEQEISFMPARVLLQDLTGVPAFVDLAAMRDAMRDLGGDPSRINPRVPADLVIDHSVQVDAYGSSEAFAINERKEMERSKERYGLLRWAQGAFSDVRVMPPDSGIVHQVNLEYLATVIFASGENGTREAYPDTLVGLDSHTTMINGLGVLGWGVGGIEAEAVMLGQPVSMLIKWGNTISPSCDQWPKTTRVLAVFRPLASYHGSRFFLACHGVPVCEKSSLLSAVIMRMRVRQLMMNRRRL